MSASGPEELAPKSVIAVNARTMRTITKNKKENMWDARVKKVLAKKITVSAIRVAKAVGTTASVWIVKIQKEKFWKKKT